MFVSKHIFALAMQRFVFDVRPDTKVGRTVGDRRTHFSKRLINHSETKNVRVRVRSCREEMSNPINRRGP